MPFQDTDKYLIDNNNLRLRSPQTRRVDEQKLFLPNPIPVPPLTVRVQCCDCFICRQSFGWGGKAESTRPQEVAGGDPLA